MLEQLRKLLGSNGFPPRYFTLRGEHRAGGFINSDRALSALLTNTGHNIYVHLNPSTVRPFSPKASNDDTTEFCNILVDIDPVSPDAQPLYTLHGVMDRMESLISGSASSVSIVDSGRGVQVWMHFERTPLTQGELRSSINRATAALLRLVQPEQSFGCRVDTSCADLARVARLPGSTNQKTGRIATIIHNDYTTFLRLDSLLALDPGPPPPPVIPNHIKGAKLGFVLPYLTFTAASFLTQGASSPGRHARAYAAAASLREVGIDIEQAQEWVALGGRCCDPPLSQSECVAATRNAYNR